MPVGSYTAARSLSRSAQADTRVSRCQRANLVGRRGHGRLGADAGHRPTYLLYRVRRTTWWHRPIGRLTRSRAVD